MFDHQILTRASELADRGEAFALATVVARTAPSSARVGRKALIRADGTLEGWLGGSCIEPVVRREAAAALRERRSRYVVLTPDGETDRPDASVHPMTCHSGGTVEIFVEPQLPAPALTLFGDSPVNRALCRLGPVAGFRVEVVGPADRSAFPEARVVDELVAADGAGDGAESVPEAERYAVVATMGEWDEDAVRQALDAGARYVGLVASPVRAEEVRRRVEEGGARWGERVRSPAGLDLGAEDPGEIAVTILAEVIEARRSAGAGDVAPEREPGGPGEEAASGAEPGTEAPESDVAVDPVCGMDVDVTSSRHVYVHRGTTYHFCCAGCRERFAREPERWIGEAEAGGADGG